MADVNKTPWEHGRQLILVVDEDPVTNAAAADILSDAGYDVLSSYTWASAQRIIWELRPDLVILDIMLPDASGVEKCRELIRDVRTSDMPIVMVSMSNTPPVRKSSYLAGSKHFVHKTAFSQELLKTAKRALAGAAAEKSLWNDISLYEKDPPGFLNKFIRNATN